MAFHLRKWYMDCVAPDGATFIGYSARLSWGLLKFSYASSFSSPPKGESDERRITGRHGGPVLRDDRVRWECPKLGLEAVWHRTSPPIERVLLDTPKGAVTWRCHVPRGQAEIQVPGFGSWVGTGYVEEMEMRVPPWELPLDQLRWGRFLSPEESVTWLEWKGPHPLCLVYQDGAPMDRAWVEDDVVGWDGTKRLDLGRVRVLREGELGVTTLPHVPFADKLLPKQLSGVHETKWLSKGTLTAPEARMATGWAVHERVQWR